MKYFISLTFFVVNVREPKKKKSQNTLTYQVTVGLATYEVILRYTMKTNLGSLQVFVYRS